MITAIKNYLDNMAKSDELFAAKYANPKKSIDECCKYITGEAYARAKDGTAVISDEEVYGMAVRYYDEENIEIRKAPSVKTSSAEPELTEEQQEKLRKQAEKEYKAKVMAELEQKEKDRKAKVSKPVESPFVQLELF